MAILAGEHYNRIARLLDRNIPVKLQIEIRTEVDDSYKDGSVNVITEIPGGAKKDEVVMIGAHLDSWPYATGATDNAIGSAVAMEAMRILHQSGLKMDRTVRLALWSGEEQGRLGSRAYVKQHFADPADMQLKPEHEKLSAYFNLDGGTGKIQGIYLRRNEMARPIFRDWFRLPKRAHSEKSSPDYRVCAPNFTFASQPNGMTTTSGRIMAVALTTRRLHALPLAGPLAKRGGSYAGAPLQHIRLVHRIDSCPFAALRTSCALSTTRRLINAACFPG